MQTKILIVFPLRGILPIEWTPDHRMETILPFPSIPQSMHVYVHTFTPRRKERGFEEWNWHLEGLCFISCVIKIHSFCSLKVKRKKRLKAENRVTQRSKMCPHCDTQLLGNRDLQILSWNNLWHHQGFYHSETKNNAQFLSCRKSQNKNLRYSMVLFLKC